MGTPDFAVPALNALFEHDCGIELVVTMPDRPKGRGRKMTPTPVKAAALQSGCEVIQPETVKTEEFVEKMKQLEPDLFVVVAFGHILSPDLLAVPKKGAINIHASILPKYRGPAPIQWAVINGEKETGVTSMLMDEGMDTGDIVMYARETIECDDTSATLHDRLAVLGGKLLVRTIEYIEAGEVKPVSQDKSLASYAPMLKKADGRIDWSKSAKAIDAFVRGMTPWPGAFTFLGEKRLKIFKVQSAELTDKASPGTVIKGFEDELRVAVGDKAVSLIEIQGASGKRLQIKDFLRGKSIPEGTVLN